MVTVTPTLQTRRVAGSGDVADMAIIWLHPTDRTLSLILAGSKEPNVGGLHVWEMDGDTELQFLQVGAVNSIDVRYNFPLGEALVDLVALSNRTTQTVQFYVVNPTTRTLTSAGSHAIDSDDIYGFCLAHDISEDRWYSIPNTEDGIVEQWELDGSTGTIQATKVRTISVGSQTEGAVADDEAGWLFVGEEDVAIWRYGLDPSTGSSRTQIDHVSSTDIAADIEGLAIYYEPDGAGYLIASSQGNSRFAVYERQSPHDYLGWFEIGSGSGIDAVQDTDGISVTNRDTSEQFPLGLFIVHDGVTAQASTNYKVVPWQSIATALELRTPDTSYDPRRDDDPEPPDPEEYIWGPPGFATSGDPGGIEWGAPGSASDVWVVGAGVPEVSGALAVTIDATGTLNVPPASVPELTGTLDAVVALVGTLDVPPATVPTITGTLTVDVAIAGTLDTPAANVPTITGTLGVDVTTSGTLDTPTATVPTISGTLDTTITLAGALADPGAQVPTIAGSLDVTVATSGLLDVPTPSVPGIAGSADVAVTMSGTLAQPDAPASLAGSLDTTVTIAGVLDVPEASVPAVTGTLDVVVAASGVLALPDAPAALTGTLDVTVTTTGVLHVPQATVPTIAGALDTTVTMTGTVASPSPAAPTVTGRLDVAVTSTGVLAVPTPSVPDVAGQLAVLVTLAGTLGDVDGTLDGLLLVPVDPWILTVHPDPTVRGAR